MKSFQSRLLSILVLSILGAACTASGVASDTRYQPDLSPGGPVRASILLLIPDEFERYVYVHPGGGEEVHLQLGHQATDQMKALLRGSFASPGFMPVRSEAEARDLLSAGGPEIRQYDLIAIPGFTKVDSWASDHEFGYDINVSLEIYSPDMVKPAVFGGRGQTRTGIYGGDSPWKSAGIALSAAMNAVKNGLEKRRSTLEVISR